MVSFYYYYNNLNVYGNHKILNISHFYKIFGIIYTYYISMNINITINKCICKVIKNKFIYFYNKYIKPKYTRIRKGNIYNKK